MRKKTILSTHFMHELTAQKRNLMAQKSRTPSCTYHRVYMHPYRNLHHDFTLLVSIPNA